MSDAASPSVAVVGSGPSGCYLAQVLRKTWPKAAICVIDRLPVPYGLIRYGVAPDHQGTKTVTRQFDRLFEREGVRFLGNVEVGKDLPLQALRDAFDAVVLATGLHGDRRLGVPGDDHPAVYGAGRVTRLANTHPDEAHDDVRLGRRVVVVGHGNVAIDVLRLIVKSDVDFLNSDVDDDALAAMMAEPVERIDIIGRSPVEAAKFDTAMVRELGRIEGVAFEWPDGPPAIPVDDGENRARVEALASLPTVGSGSARVTVAFRFGWSPARVEDCQGGLRVAFSGKDGETLQLDVDSAVTAVGFTERAGLDIARSEVEAPGADLPTGRLDARLYCTGWFRRGPRGTIPENRADARMVAEAVVTDLGRGEASLGRPGVEALPPDVLAKAVDFRGWKAIEAAEVGAARAGRLRRKIKERAHLLDIVRAGATNNREDPSS